MGVVCNNVCVVCIYICVYVCMYVLPFRASRSCRECCISVYMCVCVYIRTGMSVCVYIHIYTHIAINMYTLCVDTIYRNDPDFIVDDCISVN